MFMILHTYRTTCRTSLRATVVSEGFYANLGRHRCELKIVKELHDLQLDLQETNHI
ncbi:hypothetical protein SCLCIDRAFT_1220462 [Scleroderma citrinum Foug A]|uniref:Uncharacterized protein n=1 Tax=Scleroderma citrinum Foug A TaxID=1036808 RepID=A0A0C3D6A0_9AGAM|nr:hypothetical protein SCLCIDRAFT_1220462 [Scleroderma citrinum Foug A]